MDDFELRLKRIPLAKPPGDMKDRIFASEPGGPGVFAVFRRRVPLGWAAMFAVLTGLAGMSLSQWLRPPTSAPAQQPVQLCRAGRGLDGGRTDRQGIGS
ncbi:MAG: hypothetical protein ACYST6_07015 [Planctomycetota bacterium]